MSKSQAQDKLEELKRQREKIKREKDIVRRIIKKIQSIPPDGESCSGDYCEDGCNKCVGS